jgi:hypothetical protein
VHATWTKLQEIGKKFFASFAGFAFNGQAAGRTKHFFAGFAGFAFNYVRMTGGVPTSPSSGLLAFAYILRGMRPAR